MDKLVLARDAHKTANSWYNLRPPLSYTEQVATIQGLYEPKRTPATPKDIILTTKEKEIGAQAAREGRQPELEQQVFTRTLAHIADLLVEADAPVDDQRAQQNVEKIQKHISTISSIEYGTFEHQFLCPALLFSYTRS
ncbi:MAG: hypothetical protein Q9205_007021 [Flavoplaca limonia]